MEISHNLKRSCGSILREASINLPLSKKPKFVNLDDILMNGETITIDAYCPFILLDAEVEAILQNTTEEYFEQCFHFNKALVRCLLMELHQCTFYHPDADLDSLSFDMGVLATLHYLTNGNLEMSELSFFRRFSAAVLRCCIQETCKTIVNFLSPVYVKFPCQRGQLNNKSDFLRQFGVPGIVGVLDCFYLGLQKVPEYDQHLYINHRFKGPSIAVQLICDHNNRFLDVNPRFSGASNNAHVWRRSHINDMIQHYQKTNPNTWLVADRGYKLNRSVINPYRNATDMLQESVNVALKEIQKVAFKSFAVLKGRFRCLDTVLPFNHKNAANVITACVTLHNYLMAKGYSLEDKVTYNVPPAKKLPNAHNEDSFSPEGLRNREFIKDFIYNNSMQVLYKLRKKCNLNFFNGDSENLLGN